MKVAELYKHKIDESTKAEQKYKLKWATKVGVRAGKTLIVPFNWFDSDGGFDRQERSQIKKMNIGDKMQLGEGDDAVFIERVSDDTPEGKDIW